MIPLMIAALAGGIATGATAMRYGALAAFAAAPFGGSAAALAAAVMLARRRVPDWQSRAELDEQSDAMVRALRNLAEQGRAGEVPAAAAAITEPPKSQRPATPQVSVPRKRAV